MNKLFIFSIFFLISQMQAAASDIIQYTENSNSLETRWDWAWEKKSEINETCWIAFSTDILMHRKSSIGNHYRKNKNDYPILEEILYGLNSETQTDGEVARQALQEWKSNKNELIYKEVVFLFLFPASA